MNLNIQKANNKLNNNLRYLKLDDIHIIEFDPNNILYRSHYKKKYTHVLFVESLLTSEIKQFISEFFQSVKIFIYHDTVPNMEIIKDYGVAATHIVNKGYVVDKAIALPDLINDQLFAGMNNNKNEDTVCFLEYRADIPNELTEILYPKTKHRIKLFNSPYIKHVQNLGLISESEKAEILQSSKYYFPVDDNDEYLAEAVACGCIVLNRHSLQPMDLNIDLLSYQTYASFIKELLND
jgi:hypothetical protein